MSATLYIEQQADEHSSPGHPERPERIAAIRALLKRKELWSELIHAEPVEATAEQLERVHQQDYLARLEESARGLRQMLDGDTFTTTDSYLLARKAAGAACLAVDEVMNGAADNAFVAARPPGHHAFANGGSGFCLINNVAVAARHAQNKYGLERILIIDFDVHHGNGTQKIFCQDDKVLFISVHQFHSYFYPGSGHAEEAGKGEGEGATVNVPLQPGAGDEAYAQTMEMLVKPLARRFKPQLVLVSAGYDAHWSDPLATGGLSVAGFRKLVDGILEVASACCGGKSIFILEGGYQLAALSYGVLNSLMALMGRDDIDDPIGPSPYEANTLDETLDRLIQWHLAP